MPSICVLEEKTDLNLGFFKKNHKSDLNQWFFLKKNHLI